MKDSEMKGKILVKVEEAIRLAETKLGMKFEVPVSTFNLRGKTAGKYKWEKKGNKNFHELQFQLAMAKENEEKFMDTVLHEVAHYVARMRYGDVFAHGTEWKEVAKLLGCNGERLHDMVVPKKVGLPEGDWGEATYTLPAVKGREAAKEDEDVLYWSGTECENGHKSPRYVRDNVCKECYRIKRLAAKAKKEAELKEKWAAEEAA